MSQRNKTNYSNSFFAKISNYATFSNVCKHLNFFIVRLPLGFTPNIFFNSHLCFLNRCFSGRQLKLRIEQVNER